MKETVIIVQNKLLAGLFILLLYTSCAEKKWDEYYVKPDYLNKGSMMNFLSENSNYREFVGLLRKTGYDSLLSRNDRFTVFALKNGSFSGIDTVSDRVGLKKILGMHIIASAVFSDKMNDSRYLSLSGKLLQFADAHTEKTVNKIKILSFDKRLLNGVVHEVDRAILPKPNIFDYTVSDPGFSYLKSFIDSNYVKIVDKEKNIVIGFDSIGNPLYKLPIVYKLNSDYMSFVKTDDEKVLSTIFLPTKSALNKLYSKLLDAREGNMNLIIPKIGRVHGDTIFGEYFIPKNTAFIGDSAVLMDYYFRNSVIRGLVSDIAGTGNSFTNISGNQFFVKQSQIKTESTIFASNGNIYTLNDVTLPDVVFRRSFVFRTTPKVTDPENPTKTIANPGLVYRKGASSTPSESSNSAAFGGKYTIFDFRTEYAEMDVIMPFVTKGIYKVILKVYNPFTYQNTGVVDTYYLGQKLNRYPDLNRGYTRTDALLGVITVANSGPVTFTFVCLGSPTNFKVPISAVILSPVDSIN